jgi:hypothetical protein
MEHSSAGGKLIHKKPEAKNLSLNVFLPPYHPPLYPFRMIFEKWGKFSLEDARYF